MWIQFLACISGVISEWQGLAQSGLDIHRALLDLVWQERCKLYLDRLQCRASGFVGSLVNRGVRSPELVLGLGVLACCYFEFECLESLLKGLPVHDAILAFAGRPCHLPCGSERVVW